MAQFLRATRIEVLPRLINVHSLRSASLMNDLIEVGCVAFERWRLIVASESTRPRWRQRGFLLTVLSPLTERYLKRD